MNQMRVPMGAMLEPRDTLSDKDGVLRNCYVEMDPEGSMVVKRPGTSLVFSYGCTGQGAVWFGGNAVFVACDTLVIGKVVSMKASVKAGAL